jgi:hypothetical protein
VDVDFDGAPFIEPSPDEDAWEAFIALALDRLGDDTFGGITNAALAEVERIVGHQLPLEVGMLLVMGQPETPPWVQWDDDPAATWATWCSSLVDGIVDAVEDGLWLPAWGVRPDGPDAATQRRAVVAGAVEASPLFPLWGRCAMPLAVAAGKESNDGNPVLSVHGAEVAVAGVDLAAWMQNRFGIPLPMWQPDTDRRFPLWSDLVDRTLDGD